MLQKFKKEIAEAFFEVYDIYERDEYVFLETNLGTFSRRIEDDTEYEIDVALQVYDSVSDFIKYDWQIVE